MSMETKCSPTEPFTLSEPEDPFRNKLQAKNCKKVGREVILRCQKSQRAKEPTEGMHLKNCRAQAFS